MKSRYLTPSKPRFFAHRGASGAFPENTLPAFLAATAAGIPYLELDVWATSDGQVVTHHDETLQRLCGDPRRLSALTLDQLQNLDAGHTFTLDEGRSFPFRAQGVKVPTLLEVFAACPNSRFNIEIKDPNPAAVDQTVNAIHTAGRAADVLLAAEEHLTMERIRLLCGEIPTSLSFNEAAAFFSWLEQGCRDTYRPPGVALQIPEFYGSRRLIMAESIAAAHAVGLEVHVWTVNQASDFRRFLALGVDGVMSDYPELFSHC